ncbi:hypothetical protein SAMN02745945_01804 [Peptoclostridium litorale DSM 5388]|uniref:Uncharacterized protein n=1 Tax=Peptoclostridium litorale DSM 5388 TaxID=1121324 RepID=A0A069RP19_PEPLI|nr:hypothetical protein [Peptoclostridium litorale]KDR95922.1 hypothetical protein CLIT_8c00910 [Peptoclostridium litorale DSM 5388]SIO09911.1 hypothetical protein SAMN02745945_01804 [Peptoclostridium litorale DSM 5388]
MKVKLLNEIKTFLEECYVTEDSPEGNREIVNTFYERWRNDEEIQEAIGKLET